MLNKIFISHWKITLIVSTLGLIAWAIIAALYWIAPVARLIEVPITLQQLTQKAPESNQDAANKDQQTSLK